MSSVVRTQSVYQLPILISTGATEPQKATIRKIKHSNPFERPKLDPRTPQKTSRTFLEADETTRKQAIKKRKPGGRDKTSNEAREEYLRIELVLELEEAQHRRIELRVAVTARVSSAIILFTLKASSVAGELEREPS